jgi:hypothetical protein
MGFFAATLFLATFFFVFLEDFFAAVRLGEARLRAVFFLAAILFLGAVFRLFFLTAIGRSSLVSRIAQSMWTENSDRPSGYPAPDGRLTDNGS